MTQTLLDEKLQSEIDNLKRVQQSDLNCQRLINSFTTQFKERFEELKVIEDPQLLLEDAVTLLNEAPKLLSDIATEVIATRRELRARVVAIRDCRDQLVEEIEAKIREEERVQGLADKIKDGENVKSRKIGEHPARLKEVRKAQELVDEEAKATKKMTDIEVTDVEEEKEG